MANIVASGIKSLTLDVNGATFKVASLASTWEINAIPACEVSVAVGYNAFTSALAEVHNAGDSVLRRAKATVNIELEGEQSAGKSWPGGGVIFEGYLHSVRPTRTTSGAGVSITLYHWLSDLNTSHFGFAAFTPRTPWDIFKTRPLINVKGMPNFLFKSEHTQVDFKEIYTDDLADMFFDGLKFSLEDGNNSDVDPFRSSGDSPKPKPLPDKALDALERIENLGCQLSAEVSEDSKPLNEGAVLEQMGAIAHNKAGGSTAWTKVLAFCNIFQLAIIPAVEDAYIAPIDPGSTDFAIEIGNNEIDLGQGSGFEVHLPRGVVMMGPHLMTPKGTLPAEGKGLAVQTVGQYVVPDAPENPEGPIDVIPPPKIFNINFVMGSEAGESEGVDKLQIMADSEEPEGPQIDEPDETPKYVFADDWCKNYYWNYVYARRQQAVNSVLRFDITPGTIVKVDIAQASVAGSGAASMPGFAGNVIYGMAEKIVYSMSADSNSISTVILVKYLKSEKDAELAKIQGADDNPLFEVSYGTQQLYKPLQNTLGNI
jgi:hypothetical protein